MSTLSGHTGVVTNLTPLGEGRLASGSYDQTIKVWTLPPSLQLPKTGVVAAPEIAGANVLDVGAMVSPLSPASSTDAKADGYSTAAGLAAFGSKALHHAPSASESAGQTVAGSNTVVATPKHTPME